MGYYNHIYLRQENKIFYQFKLKKNIFEAQIIHEMYMNVKSFTVVFGFYCNFQCNCALILCNFSSLNLFMKN